MQKRKYGAGEAWIGLKLGLDPSQLEVTGGMPAWVHYKHPLVGGPIVVHPDNIYLEGKAFFYCGLNSLDFKAFQAGFYGKKPFPKDKRGRELYSKGIDAEVQASEGLPLVA